ncbi:GNAT family N-acetyltransferase [Thioclava sp. DLFJ4-1]|uniref:GNAT family N-acetyltransferase n=1 Tax=Thioclava sp. DLFJ4-1 TaxID=1915313 RepID=UPI000997AEA5|nr:GNAT family N-acetyltransferase [Thioclava sp. DLFJ4-1]OOY14556.1 GNAT family N-acetyltransferase [Thioclava sp. DLFJ4-1]
MDQSVEITLYSDISEISEEDWNACACPEIGDGERAFDPFTTHRFLAALEASGSVGPGTGWDARHLVARMGDRVIGVAPLYVKSHSQGEYVFDHGWADAFERAGGRYYPKLQCAVPFTPVAGRRLLVLPGLEEAGGRALLAGMAQIAEGAGVSSVHMTFCTEDEAELAAEAGWLPRLGQQFHWFNDDYESFEQFLGDLSSRKRKTLRKERQRAQAFGGEIVQLTGDDIRPEHWDAFWQFYQDTGARKWGRPYLSRAFFDLLHEMREDVLLVLAMNGDSPIAGALNLIGRDALFGRYWGCIEDHPFLHFELCYHQAVDYAIAHKLSRVEAGAQGEHKLARGYLPVATHSAHWIGHEGLRGAVAEYLEAERAAVDEDIEILTEMGPFRSPSGGSDEQA